MFSAFIGCSSYPSKKEDQATWHLNIAIDNYKNNPIQGCGQITAALSIPSGVEKTKVIFSNKPDMANDYLNCLSINIENARKAEELTNPYMTGLIDTFLLLKRNNVFSNGELNTLNEKLAKKVYRMVLHGDLHLDLTVDMDAFPLLSTEKYASLLFENTIEKIRIKSHDRYKQIACLVSYLNTNKHNNELLNRTKEILPSLNLDSLEYSAFQSIYSPTELLVAPSISSKTINLEVIGSDRLLLLDILDAFDSDLSNNITWVTDDTKNALKIVIEQARYAERNIPEKIDTIIYRRGQVNLVDAIFTMPEYSTFSFETVTNETDIEYAYFIKLFKNEKKISEKIVRGTSKLSNTTCRNARIQNAFGGSIPPNFIANDDMQRRCSAPIKSIEDIRRSIYKNLLKNTLQMPDIYI